jgi:hypothetical protein
VASLRASVVEHFADDTAKATALGALSAYAQGTLREEVLADAVDHASRIAKAPRREVILSALALDLPDALVERAWPLVTWPDGVPSMAAAGPHARRMLLRMCGSRGHRNAMTDAIFRFGEDLGQEARSWFGSLPHELQADAKALVQTTSDRDAETAGRTIAALLPDAFRRVSRPPPMAFEPMFGFDVGLPPAFVKYVDPETREQAWKLVQATARLRLVLERWMSERQAIHDLARMLPAPLRIDALQSSIASARIDDRDAVAIVSNALLELVPDARCADVRATAWVAIAPLAERSDLMTSGMSRRLVIDLLARSAMRGLGGQEAMLASIANVQRRSEIVEHAAVFSTGEPEPTDTAGASAIGARDNPEDRVATSLRHLRVCSPAEKPAALAAALDAIEPLDGYGRGDAIEDLLVLLPDTIEATAGQRLLALVGGGNGSDRDRAKASVRVAMRLDASNRSGAVNHYLGPALGLKGHAADWPQQMMREDGAIDRAALASLIDHLAGRPRHEALDALALVVPMLVTAGGPGLAGELFDTVRWVIDRWP